MPYLYTTSDGACQSNDIDFINNYNKILYSQNDNRRNWIEQLKNSGVKAAHPDDGWVDRENNIVIMCYPYFNDELSIGDILALGDWNSHRLVCITNMQYSVFGICCYHFIEKENNDVLEQ